MSTATCRFADIEKHYRERRVLAIDSLTLQPGCLHHLTGCNGAGKTTLLRILAGLEPPDRGLVQWDGCQRPWAEMRPYLQREVIYLHQRPFMFDASVTANLDYGLRVTGVARAERRRRIAAALELMALERLAQRHARTLSGGEQQRLALARAWVLRPRLLLLDEPTANLDPAFRRDTWNLLHDMRHRDLAILICSHELDTARWPGMINLHLQDGRLTPARPPLHPVPAGSTAPPFLQGVLP